jgi:hypothetical protein
MVPLCGECIVFYFSILFSILDKPSSEQDDFCYISPHPCETGMCKIHLRPAKRPERFMNGKQLGQTRDGI